MKRPENALSLQLLWWFEQGNGSFHQSINEKYPIYGYVVPGMAKEKVKMIWIFLTKYFHFPKTQILETIFQRFILKSYSSTRLCFTYIFNMINSSKLILAKIFHDILVNISDAMLTFLPNCKTLKWLPTKCL
jgi:hypothetical protein